MDISNLMERHSMLSSYLRASGYSAGYINVVNRCIRLALEFGESDDIESYDNLLVFISNVKGWDSTSSQYKELKVGMGAVMRFDLKGSFPDGSRSGLYKKPAAIDCLNNYYRSLVDDYLKFSLASGKRQKTIESECYTASKFYLHLQNQGANNLEQVLPEMVYQFFHDGTKQIRSYSYSKPLRRILKSVTEDNASAVLHVLELLPCMKRGQRLFQYLLPDEAQKIRICLEDKSNSLTLGERAIGYLLYYYGLRGADIRTMKLKDIDWEHDIIHKNQSKTGLPICLPLNAVTGNAIYDYITQERPRVKVTELFIANQGASSSRPYTSIRTVVLKIFHLAGVRESNGIKGARVLRHHFVTHLINNNVECQVVSSLVGHKSPESIRPYADVNLYRLKECAIDMSEYSLNKDIYKL